MNNFKKNKMIIETIKESSELFKDLQVLGNNLVFRDTTVDLNNVDIEAIINNIPEITPDNLYSALAQYKTKKNNASKWEIVKQENPSMKNVTIFNNHNLEYNKEEEFINIRTSDGKNHLFKNSIDLDIFNEYNKLKATYGDDISPDILAANIQKWQLNELEVETADKTMNNPNINENVKNQVQEYLNKYKGNNNIEITVNANADIIYINDTLHPEANIIITFTKDINNELVAVEHHNNLSSEAIYKENVDMGEPTESTNTERQPVNEINSISNSVRESNNTDYQNTTNILSDNDLSHLVSKGNYSSTEVEMINNYINNLDKMIDNKDPNVESKMQILSDSIANLQIFKDTFTPEEQTVIDKFYELSEKLNKSLGLDKGQVLTYKNNLKNNSDANNAGQLNILSIFISVALGLIALSILALYILG